jgi:hypothetical protein
MVPEVACVLSQESDVVAAQGVFVKAVMELHAVGAPGSGFKVGRGKAGSYRGIGYQLRVIQYEYGHLKNPWFGVRFFLLFLITIGWSRNNGNWRKVDMWPGPLSR